MSGRKPGLERRGQTRHGPGITLSQTRDTIAFGKAAAPAPTAGSWWMCSRDEFYRQAAARQAHRLRGINQP